MNGRRHVGSRRLQLISATVAAISRSCVVFGCCRTRQWRRLLDATLARTCDGPHKECLGWHQTPWTDCFNRRLTVSKTPLLMLSANLQSEVQQATAPSY